MSTPKRKKDEDKTVFIQRFMNDASMTKDYPDVKHRASVCLNQIRISKSSISEQVMEILEIAEDYELGFAEELTEDNFTIPLLEDYLDIEDEDQVDIFVEDLTFAKYQYIDPMTQEIFYFSRMGTYKKNNRFLNFVGKASEYQGKKVTLNKPFRTPNGPKKTSVYVKNEKGNVVKVNFGDPNMKIKKNIPERRKSFRARHNCDNPGPKYKARYWSCKAW